MLFKKLLFLAIGLFSIASLNGMQRDKRVRTRKNNTKYEKTILWHVINNDKKAIRECLKNGESIDFQAKSSGQTLLHSAFFHGRVELIKWLLARGARTDLKDTFWGLTVLDYVNEPNCSPEIKNIFTPENIELLKKERLARKEEKLLRPQIPIRARLFDYARAHPENPMLSDLTLLASLRNQKQV